MHSLSVALLAGVASVNAAAVRRQAAAGPVLTFDGRIASTAALTDFDSGDTPYVNNNVLGLNLTFSELVLFPDVSPASLFDNSSTKSFEVTINDKSIFVPGGAGGDPQSGIRRAELIPRSDLVPNNDSTTGVKTLHFSLQTDTTRAFNLSHEYQLAFSETADFSANQFILKTGTLVGVAGREGKEGNLVVTGNTNDGNPILFETPLTDGEFHNFGLKLDFDANTLQVFYSSGSDPLVQQTDALDNDLSGNGEYHFGIFKKSTDAGADSLRSGFQESGINEGIIFGGVLIEDSADGTVTLS